MGAVLRRYDDLQRVATDQPTRWMYQHVVADRIAFRIQTLQDPQRARVSVPGNRSARFDGVGKIE